MYICIYVYNYLHMYICIYIYSIQYYHKLGLEPRGSAGGLSQVLFRGDETVLGRWQASLVLLYHDKRGTWQDGR